MNKQEKLVGIVALVGALVIGTGFMYLSVIETTERNLGTSIDLENLGNESYKLKELTSTPYQDKNYRDMIRNPEKFKGEVIYFNNVNVEHKSYNGIIAELGSGNRIWVEVSGSDVIVEDNPNKTVNKFVEGDTADIWVSLQGLTNIQLENQFTGKTTQKEVPSFDLVYGWLDREESSKDPLNTTFNSG